MAKEVLIVDDDRALARSLARAIESQGYACRQAHDGNAALTAVAESTPDLILLDMLLPKKDGYGVLQTLKASAATRDVKIIAMSGIYRGRDHVATATKAGAIDYLEKPFSASDLTAKLTRHLGRADKVAAAAQQADRFDLAVNPPAELLWRAIQEGFSGALHFEDGKRHKIVVLESGRPRFLRSNLAKEALGQRLLGSGRIGQRTYEDALRRGKATGRRLGEILVDLGAIRRVELDRVLADQAVDKLLELFGWSKGESWRQAGIRAVNLASELVEWGAKETILRGVQRMNVDVARGLLAKFSSCRVSCAITELGGFEEDRAVAAAIAAVAGEKTVGDLAMTHAALIYGLYLVGGVRFDDPNLAQGSDASPTTLTNDNLRNELRAMLKRMQDQDYFEILGVERSATTSDVRKAFVKKAKIYHPDKVGGEGSKTQSVASEIFALISDAHQLLADEEQRKGYLHKLETGGLGKDDGSVKRILSAEALFKKGDELVRGRRYAEAMEVLKQALELEPEEGEFHALYGWASFLVHREDAAQRSLALEHLQKAISLAPMSPSGYYYMGLARKACEEEAEAERMFRMVLEHRPDHVEAARELRLFQMRRAKGSKK